MSRSSRSKLIGSSFSSTSPSSPSSSTSYPSTTFDTLPHNVLISIFQRCDGVTVARCGRVCHTFRMCIQSELKRPHCMILYSNKACRIFIADRKRSICETYGDDDCSSTIQSDESTSSSRHQSECDGRSVSFCTVRSISSNHSIKDFLDTVYDKPYVTLRKRLEPKPTKFEEDQVANQSKSAWAYDFDFTDWNERYECKEVVLQNFANFLERDKGSMAEAATSNTDQNGYACTPTPPWSGHSSPDVLPYNIVGNHYGGGGGSRYHGLHSSIQRINEEKNTVYDDLSDEMISDLHLLSGGRFERLADRMSRINPLHLYYKDYSLYSKRPVGLIFYHISLLRRNLRRVTLDGIQSRDQIRLEGALPMNNIDRLSIIQPDENPACIVNEEILLSWLHLPSTERAKLRMKYKNCKRLSPRGMCRFIREWQTYPEVAEFDCIIIDDDSMHPWELVEQAERDEKSYEKDTTYIRPKQSEVPAYLSSMKATRSQEQKEACRRTMEFRHKKGGKAIKYYYEDGLLIFECVSPSSSRPHSPPSPSSQSSSHLLIGCSSTRTSIPSRPGSLPRHSSLESSSFVSIHSYHPPPPSPGMFGRLIQILRSNA